MRKRFHIERQVERLANSKTLEVIEGVLHKLSHPPSILEEIRRKREFERNHAAEYERSVYSQSSNGKSYWSCDCLYCKLHRAYTYAKIRAHIAEKSDSRKIADEYWLNIFSLKNLKEQLEGLPLDQHARSHINDAKIFIGKSGQDPDGMRNYNNLKELKIETHLFVGQHKFYNKQHRAISWF